MQVGFSFVCLVMWNTSVQTELKIDASFTNYINLK
jgi:hypothetical protein